MLYNKHMSHKYPKTNHLDELNWNKVKAIFAQISFVQTNNAKNLSSFF